MFDSEGTMKALLNLALIVIVCVTPWLILFVGMVAASSWLFSVLGL
jgi:hypothetical protein